MKRTILIIIGLIVLAAAVYLLNKNITPAAEVVATPTAFDNTQYRLSLFNGLPIEEGSDYMASFMDGRVSATFCNGVEGTFEATDMTVMSNDLMATEMACQTPLYLMDLENSFMTLLTKGADYKLEGNLLTISKDNTLLVFTAVN